MKLFITLLITLTLVACSSYNNISKNNSVIENYTTKNDTIFLKSEPVAIIKHFGWEVNEDEKLISKVVVQEINFQTESVEDVISYIHTKQIGRAHV